jgi:hypothetical protein
VQVWSEALTRQIIVVALVRPNEMKERHCAQRVATGCQDKQNSENAINSSEH